MSDSRSLQKCRDLSRAAFSRNVRPRVDCVEDRNVESCFQTIRDNAADVITVDAALTERAKTKYNLRPIIAEKYNSSSDGSYYVVAVVRKTSSFQSFRDLKGAKACFTEYGSVGYVSVLATLLQQGLIQASDCPRTTALTKFFGTSCLPGLSVYSRVNMDENLKLSGLCRTSETRFLLSRPGDYGAFKCLTDTDGGDVAFVRHDSLLGECPLKESRIAN